MTVSTQMNDFWAAQTLAPGDCRLWEAGHLRLWAKREQHEWRVTADREGQEDSAPQINQTTAPPARSSWQRWAFKEEEAMIRASPAMPDKPVVVRPDSAIRIPHGNEVTFFVSVPVFLQLRIGSKNPLFLHEEPSMILSKTWFGDPTLGELCYALRTGGSRDFDGIKKGAHRAICPILIRNNSGEELNFEKLCIRAMHVNIYRGARRLWTEEIRVSYRGENHFSEISFSKDPPSFEKVGEILGAAREPAPRGSFLRKSFDSLWTF